MGIPGLTARLASYAKSINWRQSLRQPTGDPLSDNDTKEDLLIIDGPALAYHIYHRCVAAHSHAKNAFDAFPSYDEISQTLLAWLEHIEKFDLQVHKIYFDGYLPDSKRDVRHARLHGYVKQLRLFRAARLELQVAAPQQTTTGPRHPVGTLAVPTATPARLYALPALPFLVPVVIATLLNSKYSDQTSMVPTEADVACAQEAMRRPTSIVLTSDSDLLVHCENSRVMFFNELETTDDTVLKGRTYTSNNIAQDYKCDSFRPIAYLMAQDNQRSVSQAAKLVIQDKEQANSDADDWFNANFAVNPKNGALLAENYPRIADAFSHRPDPRLSELLCQWLLIPSESDLSIETAKIRTYLPFLIDDPTRASAWRASSRLRAVAHAYLSLHKHSLNIYEVDRRGERILENAVPALAKPDLLDCLAMLERSLEEVQDETNPVALLRKWAIVEVVRERWSDSGSSQITLNEVLGVIKVGDPELSWNAVHFKAQVEGMLYSLRMVEVVLRACLDHQSFEAIPHITTKSLLEVLDKNSSQSRHLMTSPNQGLRIEDSDGRLKQRLCQLFSVDSESPPDQSDQTQATSLKKSKKRRHQERGEKHPQKKRDERNMYSILAGS